MSKLIKSCLAIAALLIIIGSFILVTSYYSIEDTNRKLVDARARQLAAGYAYSPTGIVTNGSAEIQIVINELEMEKSNWILYENISFLILIVGLIVLSLSLYSHYIKYSS